MDDAGSRRRGWPSTRPEPGGRHRQGRRSPATRPAPRITTGAAH